MSGGSLVFIESQKQKIITYHGPVRSLKNRNSIPWLCARDFNEIIRSHEKIGG